MSEKERMLGGKLYNPADEELYELRTVAHTLCTEYNTLSDMQYEEKERLIKKLLPNMTEGGYIQGPVQFDYGVFTTIGKNFYANFNLTVLDVCEVKIGNDVLIGPNVSIYTALHPLRHEQRNLRFDENGEGYDYEYGKPVTIGDNCWIGGNVCILPGVHIGNRCVIGAGSVVTRDVPDGVLAVGNPCRVVREITDSDLMDMTGRE